MRLATLVLTAMLLIPLAPTIPAQENPRQELTTPALAFLKIREATNLMDVARGVQEARAAGAGEFQEEAEVRLGIPTGDMSGDGRDDVLVPTQRPSGLSALRGGDGAPLWSRGLDEQFEVWPAADLTGDGRSDAVVQTLVVTRNTETGVCGLLACVLTAWWEFYWDVSVVSGADGTAAWTKRYLGHLRLEYANGFQIIQSENVTVIVEPGERIIVSSYDAFSAPGVLLVNSTGEALRASDGAVVFSRTHEQKPDFAVMYQAGRDGAIAWEIEENAFAPGSCIAAIDACTTQTSLRVDTYDAALAPRWSYQHDAVGWTFASAVNADLDDDGEDDLLFIEVLPGDDRQRVGALAGGTLLWYGVEGIPLDLGQGDLAIVKIHHFERNAPYEVQRVDGKTGQTWLVTRPDFVRVANAATGLNIRTDHDGDGWIDLLWIHLSLENEYRTQLLVESGATGAAILEQDAAGIRPAFSPGDLDGDARPDLLAVTLGFSFDPDDTTFRLHAQAMRLDGGEIWSWDESYAQMPGLSILGGSDLVGDAGDDLVFTTITMSGAHARTRIQTLDGATGTAAWTNGGFVGTL